MEEIEEAECKNCARLSKSGWKPANAKKLDARGDRGAGPSTITIFDADCRDTRNVEENKVNGAGWHQTRLSNAMAKLVGSAEVKQSNSAKEHSCPLLETLVSRFKQRDNTNYLDSM